MESLLAYVGLRLTLLLQCDCHFVDNREVYTHIVIDQFVIGGGLQDEVKLHWISGEHNSILIQHLLLAHEHDPLISWQWSSAKVSSNDRYRVHEPLGKHVNRIICDVRSHTLLQLYLPSHRFTWLVEFVSLVELYFNLHSSCCSSHHIY